MYISLQCSGVHQNANESFQFYLMVHGLFHDDESANYKFEPTGLKPSTYKLASIV